MSFSGSGKNITRRLAFSPDATIFKDLVAKVSKGLNLEEAVGVADANQLESTIIDQGLIAGIEFHHSNVSLHVFCLSIDKYASDSQTLTHCVMFSFRVQLAMDLIFSKGIFMYRLLVYRLR